jgi:ATP-dependent Clp protease ATP-binding subunit ClpC
MRRTIQKELEDPLSSLILEGNCLPGAVFTADAGGDGTITVRLKLPEGGAEPEIAVAGTADVPAP